MERTHETSPQGTEGREAQLLLEIVERDRERRRREILEAAQEEARALVRKARRDARETVARVVREERRRLDARVAETHAAVATRARASRQTAARSLLERVWCRLPDALEARWRDAGQRKAWIGAVLRLSAEVLPPGAWVVVHGTDWSEDAAKALCQEVEAITGASPTLEMDEAIVAGLRVRAGAACLDATVAGLLADRHDVEGRLLGELAREMDADGKEAGGE